MVWKYRNDSVVTTMHSLRNKFLTLIILSLLFPNTILFQWLTVQRVLFSSLMSITPLHSVQ